LLCDFKTILKMTKTNAARILDKMGINVIDENDLSAISVANKIGQNIKQVYKTLVLRGDKSGVFVTIIPGDEEVDLKKAAKASGNKNASMVPMKEILELTGYIRGGCSPLGMKKRYPTFIHDDCNQYEYIYVSAGIRGLQLKLSPTDLINSCSAISTNLIIIETSN
jgi:Cys-tRNA(Pro)/Cys-tRNA(Cys) deacylase